jgi:hypothetical protein
MVRTVLMLVAAGLLALPAGADEATPVRLGGFGSWGYGNTNRNDYLGGSPEGDYDRVELGFTVLANPSDRLSITAQAFWDQDDEGTHVDVDYAFAEWRFSDALRLRAGLAKHPIGNYSEFINVGTLRPFFDLPQAVYGPVGFVTRSYKGIGFTGLLGKDSGGGWGLAYDVYGGEMNIVTEEHGASFDGVSIATGDPETEKNLMNLVGGRFTVFTPVEGLKMGASAYSGVSEELEDERDTAWGAHAEFAKGQWTLRSEFLHRQDGDELKADGFYVEASRRLGRHWQVAGLYDRLDTELPELEFEPPASLLEHDEWAVGLNYWFAGNFVLKASYHVVKGNRLAGPGEEADEELDELIEEGALGGRTKMFRFGAQFSF